MLRRPVLALLLLLPLALSGCLDPFRPHVDPVLLEDPEHNWVVDESPQQDGGTFGPNLVQTEYRFDPPDNGPPYPGLLILTGIRALTRPDSQELLDSTRDILNDALEDEGVTVDPDLEQEGVRELASGARSSWFMLVGTSESSDLFNNEEEVRAFGETWYDGRSNTAVIAVAMAQTTGSGFLSGEARDHTIWDELVGDPDGTVDGAFHDDGFIHHTISHG